MKLTKLTHQRLLELLDYNPKTGLLTRNISTSNNTKVGDIVGSKHHDTYSYVMLDYDNYSTHRLAWFHFHGKWPKQYIDHINGDTSDNRIENLRDVSFKTNAQNERKPRKTNTSGFLGVYYRKERNKWVAQVRVDGRNKRFGSFNTPEEAYQEYLRVKRLFHEGCTI